MTGGTPQQGRIADALVLCLTRGMSLSAWRDSGVLDREWALYRRLSKRYGRVVVCTWGDDAAAAKGLGVEAVRVSDEDPSGSASRVAAVVKGANAATAVVKTNQFEGGSMALAVTEALRGAGVRAALVARGGYPWSRFQAWKFGPDSAQARGAAAEERALCADADIVIGTTATMIDDLAWRYEMPGSKTRVVPNYVLADAFERERSGSAQPFVLAAGRLEPQKRFDTLIRAFAAARSRGVLRVYGQGPLDGKLRRLAASLGVRLELPGRVGHADLLRAMRSCDLFVQCSAFEGHPKTLLEAMASGACVLVTDTTGLGGCVEHLRTGFKVGDDEAALGEAMGLLLSDTVLRDRLGTAARAGAKARFDLGVVEALEASIHAEAVALAVSGGSDPWSRVRMLVFDFDGVMSNNQVLVMQDGTEGVLCNRSDGMGVEMLRRAAPEGFSMLVLSKEMNPVVAARCRKLKLECHQGVDDKLPHLKKLAMERGVEREGVAYVGNDLNDVACMGWAGLPIAVADAYPECKTVARHVTRAKGGLGAVREVCDRLIAALRG